MLPRSFYGVDIASRSAKIVKVTRTGGGYILERALHVPFPAVNPDTSIWKEQAAALIRKAIAESGMKVPSAVLGISGRDAIIRYSRVPPVQPWRLKMIMKYQVEEMAGKQEDGVTSDYRILNLPRGHMDEFTLLVAMAKNEFVSNRLEVIKKAGIMPISACPSPVALHNTFVALKTWEEDKTYLLMDVGRDNTDIAIAKNGELYFARTASMGGGAFTKALAEETGQSEEFAEKMKMEEGVIKIDGHVTQREEKVSNALMSTAAQMANMVTSTLQFAKSQTRIRDLSVDKVVLSGGGSRLRGFVEYMATSLGMNVEYMNMAGTMRNTLPPGDKAQFSSAMLELACPVGLAVSEGGRRFVSMDLLPDAYRREREFKERTRFIYVAGVLALVFLITLFSLSFYASSASAKSRAALASVDNELSGREDDNRDIKDDIGNREKLIESFSRETMQGYFYSHTLFLLRNTVPPRMTITEIRMTWKDAERTASRRKKQVLLVQISGSIRSPSGDEYGELEEFKERLAADPEIGRVSDVPKSIKALASKGVQFSYYLHPAKEITRVGNMGK